MEPPNDSKRSAIGSGVLPSRPGQRPAGGRVLSKFPRVEDAPRIPKGDERSVGRDEFGAKRARPYYPENPGTQIDRVLRPRTPAMEGPTPAMDRPRILRTKAGRSAIPVG